MMRSALRFCILSATLLAAASMAACSSGGTTAARAFYTAEVGMYYSLPAGLEGGRVLSPEGEELPMRDGACLPARTGEYTVECGGKKYPLHVVDTTAPGFVPLTAQYQVNPELVVYVNAGEQIDLNDLFIATDNSGEAPEQSYEVFMDGAFAVELENGSLFTPVLTDYYSVTAYAKDGAGNVGKLFQRLTVLPTVEGVLAENPEAQFAFGLNAKKEKVGYAGSICIPTQYEAGTNVTVTAEVRMIFGAGSHSYARLHALDGTSNPAFMGYSSKPLIPLSEAWTEVTFSARVLSGTHTMYGEYDTVNGTGVTIAYITGCYGDFILLKDVKITAA